MNLSIWLHANCKSLNLCDSLVAGHDSSLWFCLSHFEYVLLESHPPTLLWLNSNICHLSTIFCKFVYMKCFAEYAPIKVLINWISKPLLKWTYSNPPSSSSSPVPLNVTYNCVSWNTKFTWQAYHIVATVTHIVHYKYKYEAENTKSTRNWSHPGRVIVCLQLLPHFTTFHGHSLQLCGISRIFQQFLQFPQMSYCCLHQRLFLQLHIQCHIPVGYIYVGPVGPVGSM